MNEAVDHTSLQTEAFLAHMLMLQQDLLKMTKQEVIQEASKMQ